ncbi:MAG: response regulator [Nitrospinota bacterium]|nr:response regulator [Nitrospinota bacterium]
MFIPAEHIQSHYEFSMAIGTSLDLKQMLRRSLGSLLKITNCAVGGVLFQQMASDGTYQLKEVFSIPKNISHIEQYQAALKSIPVGMDHKRLAEFKASLPLAGSAEKEWSFHVVDLSDLGVLILLRNGGELDPMVIRSMSPLFEKLAGACKACLSNDELVQHRNNLLESAGDAIFIADIESGKIIDCNARAVELIGRTKDEIVGMRQAQLHPADKAEEYVRLFKEQIATGRAMTEDLVVAHKAGHFIPVDIRAQVFKLAGRQVIQGIFRDITERKKYEEEILKERQFSDSLVASLPGLFYLVDENEIFVRWNKNFEQVTGYSSDELSTMRAIDVISEEHREVVDEKLRQVLREGHAQMETFIQTRNGERIPYLFNGFNIRWEDKPYIIGVGVDMTERKLMEDQLRRSKEQADEASMAKSEFLANMSHELRTPLNGILGLSSLIMNTDIPPELYDKMKLIKYSGETLLYLVNDILDLSRIEARKMEIDEIRFSLRELVEGAASQQAMSAHEKGLEFIVMIDSDIPEYLMGDPNRLRQVIVNLVSNAIKFTETGEVVLGASLEWAREDRVMIHFSVRDTGIGIPREKREKIFQRFTQADPSTTRKYGGAGLGTSISYELVDLMGGKIWLESEVDKGSVFHFTANLMVAEPVQPSEKMAPHSIKNLKTLIVDDNATNRMVIMGMASSWGINAIAVNSGEEALAALLSAAEKGEPFDLLLLDYHMPEIDGFETVARIKRNTQLDNMRIILLSSVSGSVAARGKAMGINGFLYKPVRQSDLYNKIGAVMNYGAGPVTKEQSIPQPATADGARRLSILVVEDNHINLELLVSAVEHMGHDSYVALNGEEAVLMWESGSYDLIFMDVQMPVMSGFDATKAIRAKGGKIPIIAMTASAMKGDREKCLAAGMDDYMSKPIDLDMLSQKVGRISGVTHVFMKEELFPPLNVGVGDQVCDLTSLRQIMYNDEEKINGLLGKFIQITEKNLLEMEKALARGDRQTAQIKAHGIKGSSLQLGARPLMTRAIDLETICSDGRLENAPKAMEALREEYIRLKTEIQKR